MPVYEFVCPKCGKIEDILKQPQSTIKCPICGSAADSALSSPNFCIKGSCANPMAPIEHKEEKNEVRKRTLADYKCPKCSEVLLDEFEYSDVDVLCPKCKTKMNRLIGNVSFELKYNPKTDICDWSGNTSQYWSEVKKQRREGKNVRACNEV